MSEMSNVNHPKHYNENKFETIKEMEIVFGVEAVVCFCLCNVWKYKSRALYKNNPKEDLEKADWYLEYAKKLQERDKQEEKEKQKVGFEL